MTTYHVEEHGLGECFSNDPGIITGRDPDTVTAPDLAFFRTERSPDPNEAGYAETAPDLPGFSVRLADIFA